MNRADADKVSQGVMNPEAAVFHVRNKDLVHRGIVTPDLDCDWDHVQHVGAGGAGLGEAPTEDLWKDGSAEVV